MVGSFTKYLEIWNGIHTAKFWTCFPGMLHILRIKRKKKIIFVDKHITQYCYMKWQLNPMKYKWKINEELVSIISLHPIQHVTHLYYWLHFAMKKDLCNYVHIVGHYHLTYSQGRHQERGNAPPMVLRKGEKFIRPWVISCVGLIKISFSFILNKEILCTLHIQQYTNNVQRN